MDDKNQAHKLSRSDFLRGSWGKSDYLIRPPWSLEETNFISQCNNQCKACADACPEKIITIHRGYPKINFSNGECTFCEQCVEACDYDALVKYDGYAPWLHKAAIHMEQCITSQSVVCRSCSETCEVTAIKFQPTLGGVSAPNLDNTICNGCGACISVCPSTAIYITR